MGTLKKFMINTHFNFKNMSYFNGFLFQNLIPFGGFFLVSISALFFSLFDFFIKVFSRIQIDKHSTPNKSIRIEPEVLMEAKTKEAKPDAFESKVEEEIELIEEQESPKLFFKFEFQTQTFEELSRKFRGDDEDYNVGLESITCTRTNKYEIKSGNDFSCIIMEKPEDLSFHVKELYADSSNGMLSEEDFLEQNLKDEAEEITENEGQMAEQSKEIVGKEESVNTFPSQEEVSGNFQFAEPNWDSITSSPEFMSNLIGSDRDFEGDFEVDSLSNVDRNEGKLIEEDLEEFQNQNDDLKQEAIIGNENGSSNYPLNNSENSNLDHSFASDPVDSNDLETLWEHQELIEQLKMELKKVRAATGLPTILEESESPKIIDDLKPWKIDDKFQHADRMSELHKFYKGYRDRMRKFDILNYQKMYAIGVLQSKDPLQSISSHKSSSASAISSLLSQSLRPGWQKKSDFDPMARFIKELHGDLEMVYVGQLCLSWEILHWQYDKAIEICESDPHGIRRFNEVAGEFQQFQVLMQRFIENEPFEGPRVQSYMKNRCVQRNLLQVPVIREDSMEDKRKARRKGRDDDAVTSEMLVEIMEESIRIFWRFIRADKDANIVIQKTSKGAQVEPLEPDDLELLAEVQTSLQKKDKKLKDVVRSGNCILRKLKKNQGENSDKVLYFFSQVDLKLVARVLNMSRVTKDQLLWCHNKLSKINFVNNRKINVEPSFLLFPC